MDIKSIISLQSEIEEPNAERKSNEIEIISLKGEIN